MKIHPLIPTVLMAVGSFSQIKAEQVVVSEVMYHPPAGLYEFLEVENLTATVFDIAQWRMRGAVAYDFPGYNDGGPTNGALINTTERNTSGRIKAQSAATGEPKSWPTTAATLPYPRASTKQ